MTPVRALLQQGLQGEAMGVVYALAATLTVVLGIVLTIVKRSQGAQINGLGKRVQAIERSSTQNATGIQELQVFRGTSEQDRTQLWRAVGEGKAKMESIERQLTGMQGELRDLIVLGNQSNTKAIHEVALEVRGLAERASMADCLTTLGGQIERAILTRETRESRERDRDNQRDR